MSVQDLTFTRVYVVDTITESVPSKSANIPVFEKTTGLLKVWDKTSQTWIESGGSGVTLVANKDALDELSGMKDGDQAITEDNGAYWVYDTSDGWTSVDIPNVSTAGVQVGNVISGQSLEGKTASEIIEAIFNPYVNPTLTGFTLNGLVSGSQLIGSTLLPDTSTGFTWNYTNGTDSLDANVTISAPSKPSNFTFNNQTTTLATKALAWPGEGAQTLPYVASNLGDSLQFRIQATYTDSRNSSKKTLTANTNNITVVQSMYFGMSDTSILAMDDDPATETAIKALASNGSTPKGPINGVALPAAQNYISTTARYIAIAVPLSYITKANASGKRLSAKVGSASGADISLTNDGVVAQAKTLSMSNTAGYSETYYVFETPAALTWGAGGTSVFLSWQAVR